jgi:hypothetical protein
MITSDFVAAVRDPLDDPKKQKYSDSEIVRAGDQQQRALFQTLVYNNKEYHNMTLVLQAENGRQLFQNTYQWSLPTWVSAVVSIHERVASSGTGESTYSPYLWTSPTTIQFGRKINKLDAGAPTKSNGGWSWDGMRTVRLWNYSTKPELVVQVAKVPPKLFRAKIATLYQDNTGMYLPPSIELGTVDREEGAYINSEIQCVSTFLGTSKNYGSVVRCIYSTPIDEAADGTRQHLLRFEQPMPEPLATDDFVEALVALPEVHVRYLVLMTAQACASKKNIALIKALQAEIGEKRAAFMQYAKPPRDHAGPYLRSGATMRPIRRDRDSWAFTA